MPYSTGFTIWTMAKKNLGYYVFDDKSNIASVWIAGNEQKADGYARLIVNAPELAEIARMVVDLENITNTEPDHFDEGWFDWYMESKEKRDKLFIQAESVLDKVRGDS